MSIKMRPSVWYPPGNGLSVKIPIFAISKINKWRDCEGWWSIIKLSNRFHTKVDDLYIQCETLRRKQL